MIKIAIIFFRECLEISFLLGIILAVTKRLEGSRIYIIAGIMLGVISSSFFAFGAKMLTVSYFGLGDEIFDISVMTITVIMIIWTIIWMRGYAITLKQKFNNLEQNLDDSFINRLMLVSLVASTVLREGIELILLVYSVSVASNMDASEYLLGSGIGAFAGFSIGFIVYKGLIKFAHQHIFKVSSILLMLIAAGIAAKAAGILTSTGLLEAGTDELWDSSWLIKDNSGPGKILNALAGYTAKPNQMQAIFYLGTIIITYILGELQNYYKSRSHKND